MSRIVKSDFEGGIWAHPQDGAGKITGDAVWLTAGSEVPEGVAVSEDLLEPVESEIPQPTEPSTETGDGGETPDGEAPAVPTPEEEPEVPAEPLPNDFQPQLLPDENPDFTIPQPSQEEGVSESDTTDRLTEQDVREMTVDEVNRWISEHDDSALEVISLETAGRNRAGIVKGPHSGV